MKRTFGILLLLCITFNINAQLLWKVSGNGLEQPSYIMGTHHLAPFSIMDSIQGLRAALRETQQVYGEVIMNEMQKPQIVETFQKYMVTKSDTTFKSLFTPEEYEMINKYAKEYLKLDIAMMPKIKPAFLANNLLILIYMKHVSDFKPNEQLDTFFQSQAITNGKKVFGLETIEFQMEFLYNQDSLKRQAEKLLCMLNNIDANIDQTQRSNHAYMTQNLEEIEKIFDEEIGGPACGFSPTEKAAMLSNRNKAWAEKLPAIMKEAPTFIAVGAGHLPGKEGLLDLLKEQGYKIEPVK